MNRCPICNRPAMAIWLFEFGSCRGCAQKPEEREAEERRAMRTDAVIAVKEARNAHLKAIRAGVPVALVADANRRGKALAIETGDPWRYYGELSRLVS